MYGDEELEKLRKSRFAADKGFQGADQAGPRDGMRAGRLGDVGRVENMTRIYIYLDIQGSLPSAF